MAFHHPQDLSPVSTALKVVWRRDIAALVVFELGGIKRRCFLIDDMLFARSSISGAVTTSFWYAEDTSSFVRELMRLSTLSKA